MKRNKRLMQIIATAACCLVFAVSGFGQEMEKGQVEATGQVGVVAGVGTHVSFAGSLGWAVTDRVFGFGELGYAPLGGASGSVQGPGGGFQFASDGHILSFMVGAQYQLRPQGAFIPYGAAALGGVRFSGSSTTTVNNQTTQLEFSSGHFYAAFGGGARYYVSDRWGFKPELMFFAGEDSFVRFGAGLFYQFGR
jgi:opacity protein-like surface antigen